jgi:hypothetical protein
MNAQYNLVFQADQKNVPKLTHRIWQMSVKQAKQKISRISKDERRFEIQCCVLETNMVIIINHNYNYELLLFTYDERFLKSYRSERAAPCTSMSY